MRFYLVGECPVCVDGLIALLDKKNGNLSFYCPSCCCSWDSLPKQLDEINSFEKFAPNGAVAASKADLLSFGVSSFEATDIYESVDDIL